MWTPLGWVHSRSDTDAVGWAHSWCRCGRGRAQPRCKCGPEHTQPRFCASGRVSVREPTRARADGRTACAVRIGRPRATYLPDGLGSAPQEDAGAQPSDPLPEQSVIPPPPPEDPPPLNLARIAAGPVPCSVLSRKTSARAPVPSVPFPAGHDERRASHGVPRAAGVHAACSTSVVWCGVGPPLRPSNPTRIGRSHAWRSRRAALVPCRAVPCGMRA